MKAAEISAVIGPAVAGSEAESEVWTQLAGEDLDGWILSLRR